jgi:hydroxyethylthiazole kinase-like uncharacterized protein yjeF
MMPRLATDRDGARSPHRVALPVAAVRRLESELMAALPPGTLMQRAATALDVECARLLQEHTGGVAGRQVVLLVGAGDNGGDALYAGARLARRGVAVTALLVGARHHEAGAVALRAAGGSLHQVDVYAAERIHVAADELGWTGDQPLQPERELVADADLVVDGVLGIGGRGGLRGAAAVFAVGVGSGVPVVAVDLPSGVDADTGQVPGVAVRAQLTVAMGVLKPGLLLGGGREHAGEVVVVDIGLELDRADSDELVLVDDDHALRWLDWPRPGDDKYTRGVVGVSAGSARYPGAAVLCTGSARHVDAGFVRYAGPAAQEVVRRWPDVVVTDGSLADAGRVQCWVVGPGRGTGDDAVRAVLDALACELPVVLDADALTVVAERPDVRAAMQGRRWPTVLTPHAGEFARLQDAYGVGGDVDRDRVTTLRSLADATGAVVLLKGTTTLVASGGSARVHVVTSGPPELATAGSGDVLSGLIGSVLAHQAATWLADWFDREPVEAGVTVARSDQSPEAEQALEQLGAAVAAAAHLHGVAGQVAAHGGRSVAALDVLAAVPEAVATVRASEDPL